MDQLLFRDSEKSIDKLLTSFCKIIPQLSFIENIYRVPLYNDEPKFFHFICRVKEVSKKTGDGNPRSRDNSGGTSLFSEKEAYLKCVAEALERYYSSSYFQSNFIKNSFSELGKNKAVDPKDFSAFSKKQLLEKGFEIFNFDNNSVFSWMKGFEISPETITSKFIPAQLIYFNYRPIAGERYIRLNISTGTAGGGSKAAAILRGIYETIERDSFMIHYLKRLHGYKVDLSKINRKSIQKIIDITKRYRLEAHVIDITTDINIPSFATLLIDRTGIGDPVTIGLKSNLDPYKAICNSFEESLHVIGWMREYYEYHHIKTQKINPEEISSAEDRGMYWYDQSKLKYLDFWTKQKPKKLKKYPKFTNYDSGPILKEVLKILEENHLRTYFVNLTPKPIGATGFYVIKVIIPELYPFYVDEAYKYLGVKRLYEVPKLLGYKVEKPINNIPHPFI
ncbi:MAG: YcaO-like family protein [Patescibacteria group bacterium]|nr:YcaO-like family protein [Patescibacteria group bacterium]MCL5095657.1 YcaO-like family protein [Patescibacteria group bacterium]